MARDPVCGMEVETEKAKGRSVYGGVTVTFCSMNCKKRFDADPASFQVKSVELRPVPGNTTQAAGLSTEQSPEPSNDASIDPVCRMTVVRSKAKGVSEYKGEFYYFCNPNCKLKFDRDAEAYLHSEEKPPAPAVAPTAQAGPPAQRRPSKRLKKVTLPVTGMSSASCAARIEKVLSVLSGIEEASVNFASEKVTVSYDPDSVHINDFIKTVKELGYGAGAATVVLPIQGMSCASCVEKISKGLNGMEGVVSAGLEKEAQRLSDEGKTPMFVALELGS